jgi:hypothetical protein
VAGFPTQHPFSSHQISPQPERAMVEMNPYYAHSSPVGDVFDVAAWSPRKSLAMGVVGIVLAVVVGGAAACLWHPDLLADWAPDLAHSLEKETRAIAKQYTHAITAIVCFMGVLSYVFLASGVSSVVDALRTDYYFRAGPGGFSIRVPYGFSWATLGFGSALLELNLPWSEVDRWTITQRKQLGALSPNAGNLDAHIDVRLRGGRDYRISLDAFREPARIIHNRIEEAQEMTTALLTSSAAAAPAASTRSIAGADKREAIVAALSELLARKGLGAALRFTDETSGRFVQFVQLNGDLLFDLPLQTISPGKRDGASEFFRALGQRRTEGATETEAGGAVTAVATQRSFQVNLGQDARRAADLTLEVFQHLLGAATDFKLAVESD